MRLIAIDPGKKTGIAYFDTGTQYFYSFEIDGGLVRAVDTILDMLSRVRYDVLIYEKFEIHSSTVKTDLTDAYTTLYIVGNLITLANRFKVPLVEQRPSQKTFANGNHWATLKAAGWYETEGDGHRNDAAAHLLKYMMDGRLLSDALVTKIIDTEFEL